MIPRNPLNSHLSTLHTFDAANRLLEDSSFTYTYDANGNLTEKRNKATGNLTRYTYDAENQLIKVEQFTVVGGAAPVMTAEYHYDALGRRIEKVVNGVSTRYVYDNEDIIVELDASAAVKALYVHGPGIDEPLAMFRSGVRGGPFTYHVDGLGSITTITDAFGTPVRTYTYDSFGRIVDETGTLANPYTYTSREFDPETGLFYYRARYYDPSSGVFLQTDPVPGLITRPVSLHPYAYALSNPTTLTDPSGQFPPQVGLAITGAILGGISGAFGAIIAGGDFSQVAAAAATGALAGGIVGFLAPSALSIGMINVLANIGGQVIGGRPVTQVNLTAAALAGVASVGTAALTNLASAGLTLTLGEQIGFQVAFAEAGGSTLGVAELIGRLFPLRPSDSRRLFGTERTPAPEFCPGA